jgi:hypothetical protein
VVFEKEYIMRCWSAEWIARNGCDLRWCHRGVGQVNWGNCGIPWVNCAVLCVWRTTGKYSYETCAIACQNCTVYSVFPSGMTSNSKIAQFNWQCIATCTEMWVKTVVSKETYSVIFKARKYRIKNLLYRSCVKSVLPGEAHRDRQTDGHC